MEQLFNKAYKSLNDFFETRVARWMPRFISPNAITVSRVFFIAPIITLLFLGMNLVAVILFVFSASLDYVDGALARGRKAESELGEFLDPICDKIFFCAMAITIPIAIFANHQKSSSAMALLAIAICLVCVELLLAFIRVLDFFGNQITDDPYDKKNLKADWSGKLKFNMQMIGAGLSLLVYPDNVDGPVIWLSIAFFIISLPLSAISLAKKIKSE